MCGRITDDAGEAPPPSPRDSAPSYGCIDRGIPLLTRDGDFRAFVEAAGLDLVFGSSTT